SLRYSLWHTHDHGGRAGRLGIGERSQRHSCKNHVGVSDGARDSRTGVVFLPLIKRSECLVFFFRDGKLHCKNYLTGIEIATAPVLVSVLDMLGRWREVQEVERLLAGYSPVSIRRMLARLREYTLLLNKGSAEAHRESALAPWKAWGEEASFFHFATKHAFHS